MTDVTSGLTPEQLAQAVVTVLLALSQAKSFVENRNRKRDHSELSDVVVTQAGQISALEKKLAKTERELDSERDAKRELEHKVELLNQRIEFLERDAKHNADQIAALLQERDDLKAKVAERENIIRVLEAEIKAAKSV